MERLGRPGTRASNRPIWLTGWPGFDRVFDRRQCEHAATVGDEGVVVEQAGEGALPEPQEPVGGGHLRAAARGDGRSIARGAPPEMDAGAHERSRAKTGRQGRNGAQGRGVRVQGLRDGAWACGDLLEALERQPLRRLLGAGEPRGGAGGEHVGARLHGEVLHDRLLQRGGDLRHLEAVRRACEGHQLAEIEQIGAILAAPELQEPRKAERVHFVKLGPPRCALSKVANYHPV